MTIVGEMKKDSPSKNMSLKEEILGIQISRYSCAPGQFYNICKHAPLKLEISERTSQFLISPQCKIWGYSLENE